MVDTPRSELPARLLRVAVVLCLLGATVSGVAAMPATAQQSGVAVAGSDGQPTLTSLDNRTGITRTELSGTGVAVRENGTTYVWQDGRLDLSVTMVPLDGSGDHELCLAVQNEEGAVVAQKGCRTVDVQETGSRTAFEMETLGVNESGSYDLVLTLKDFESNQTTRVPVVAITRDGDFDSDSLNNSREVDLGTGIADSDTDSDGLLDGLELTKYGSDPTQSDSDRDGLHDGREVNMNTQPTNPDTDGDGLLDGKEVNEYGTDPLESDTDGDGLSDSREVELGTDPTKKDTDTDGLSDSREVELGTDPTNPDTDDDGFNDGTEVERGSDPLDPDEPGPGMMRALSSPAMLSVIGGFLLLGVVAIVGYMRRRDRTETPDAVATERDEADDPDEQVDPSLLSPEQHVMYLLEANGGQMKQSQFVEQTDWSKAKVSRKLSRLEEDGKIKRVRIGRENVVTYPDRDLGEMT